MKKPPRGLFAQSILATLVVLMLTACGQVGLSADELHQRALQHQASGDLRAALIDFKNALQQNPSLAEARLGLGLVSLEMGDLGTARIELQRARELGLEPERLSIPFGRLWLAEGEYGRLLENLTLSETEPGDAEQQAQILHLRGEAKLAQGHFVQAMSYFEEAISIDRSAPLPHVGIAAIHMAEGREEAARASLQSALEIDRRTHQAWTLLGDIERNDARPEQAAVAYGEAIEASPTPYLIHLKRGLAWLALNETAAAEKDLEMMRRISAEHPATSYLAGLLHFEAGRYSDAQSAFQAALSRSESFQPAIFFLGASLFAQEQWSQAEHHLGRFLAANPGSVEAARLLAAVRAQDGDLERAEQLVQNVLGHNPDDPVALNLMGNIHLARGQRDTGIGYLQRLTSVRTDDPLSRVRLATELLESGYRDEGLAEFEAAVRQAPDEHQIEIAFAWNLIQNGQFEQALETANALVEKIPDSAIPHTLRAGAYLGMGETSRAREALQEGLRIAPGDPTTSINLAQMALAAGDREDASRIYRESLEQNPGHVEISMRLSLLEAERGDADAMRSVLEQAIAAAPEAVQPRLVLGRYLLRQNQPRRVLSLLEPVLEAESENAEMLSLLARAQIASGQNAPALTTVRSLARRIPATADAHQLVGQLFEQAGDLRAARDQYSQAVELDPAHASSLRHLASLELSQGRTSEALAIARRMQELPSEAARGFAIEGRVHSVTGRDDDAARSFGKAYELEPSAAHAAALGAAEQRAGRVAEAATLLAARIADHPDEDSVRLQLAQALLTLGDNHAAIREYEELLRTQQDNVVVFNNLAFLYQLEGDRRALELAEQAYALSPENPAVADTLGWILVNEGEVSRGLTLLQRARESLPERPEVRYHYAVALAKAGKDSEARAELEDLLKEFDSFEQRSEAEGLLTDLQKRGTR